MQRKRRICPPRSIIVPPNLSVFSVLSPSDTPALSCEHVGGSLEAEAEIARHRRQYHTLRWSALINTADAFVLVMPEYNHGFNAPLKNAIDYLVHEWAYKPVGFVSYGGVAAGTRAVQLLKPVLVGLKMTPIVEAVNIPFVSQLIKDGALQATASMATAAQVMLTEVQRMEESLRALRLAAREPQPARS